MDDRGARLRNRRDDTLARVARRGSRVARRGSSLRTPVACRVFLTLPPRVSSGRIALVRGSPQRSPARSYPSYCTFWPPWPRKPIRKWIVPAGCEGSEPEGRGPAQGARSAAWSHARLRSDSTGRCRGGSCGHITRSGTLGSRDACPVAAAEGRAVASRGARPRWQAS